MQIEEVKRVDKRGSSVEKNIRPHLLAVANAKIIGARKLEEIVQRCTEMGVPLQQYVYNIPKAQESVIRVRILGAINSRKSVEATGRMKKKAQAALLKAVTLGYH